MRLSVDSWKNTLAKLGLRRVRRPDERSRPRPRTLQAEPLEERRLLNVDLGSLAGMKFEDLDGDGVQDAGEPPLEGVTIYLDSNDNGVLDPATGLEPDDYPAGSVVNTVIPDVTLSVRDSANNTLPFPVTATVDNFGYASTGSQVFGHSNIPFFNVSRQLAMEFSNPVDWVSIDFAGSNTVSTEVGRLEIYDAQGNSLDTYLTQPVSGGQVETMTLSRPTADIASAVAYTQPGQGNFGRLDNLLHIPAEPSVETDAGGAYEFTDLPAGDYVVREVVPPGHTQTAPTARPSRMFATDVNPNPDQIVELDPADGSVLNVLPAPTGSSVNGLAFDGQTLYFVSAGPYTLYELDPDTGNVLVSTPIPGGRLDGVAALDGLVYVLDGQNNVLHVYDPQVNTVVNTITLNVTDSSLDPWDSLGESDGHLIAGTNSGRLANIDPVTGDVTAGISIALGPPDTAVTGFAGEIYVGYFDPGTPIHVYNTGGVLQRTLNVNLRVTGLGGAAGMADDAHRVTLHPSETITGLDFGNQYQFGDLQGTKFEDLDGDGVRDTGEPPLEGVTVYLDLNDNGVLDAGIGGEPSVVTDANGDYAFTDLPAGDYVVREVVPPGYTQTAPTARPSRLFATDVNPNPDQIVELDPADGSVLNVLPAPTGSSVNGLAFDGQTLYFVSAGPYTLYELDPDTGAVLDSTPVPSGRLDGVAALDGLVYILDGYYDRLHAYDPQSNTVVNTINLNITDPSVNPYDSLGESNGRLIAGTNSSTLAYIDPVTGDVTRAFDVQWGPPDTALTAFGGEVFVGYFDPNTAIHVYNTNGVLQRTLNVNLRVTGLGGAAGVADDAHRVTLHPSETITGLDFGNQPDPSEIRGTKFEDIDGDGVRDAGEPPLEGVTIYIDANDNGVRDVATVLEPDDYTNETRLETVIPEATLSANNAGNPDIVRVWSSGNASTGMHVIGCSSPVWSTTRSLRIDFAQPASMVSIDFIGDNPGGSRGKLAIYDAADNLLDTFVSGNLARSDIAVMSLTRPTADIAYAIAQPDFNHGLLDNLSFGAVDPSVETDANGEYEFTELLHGEYVIREVVPDGYLRTTVANPSRLFATRYHTSEIVEIDPADGSEINRFPMPFGNGNPNHGLAYADGTLYFVHDTTDTLYELDANTGTVLDATQLSSGFYDGVAVLDGIVYISDAGPNRIVLFDPVANVPFLSLPVSFDLRGGLGELPETNQLIANTGPSLLALIDPDTGAIDSTIGGFPGLPQDLGVTSIGGEIYVGLQDGRIQVHAPTGGNPIRIFRTSPPLGALAGQSGDAEAYRVTLGPGESATGLVFGNQYQFGDLSGTKFEDVDGDGTRDPGEPPLAGVTIYVDLNDNSTLDIPTVLEPDDYPNGTSLETVIPEATLSATYRGAPVDVRSSGHFNASTGERVFTNNAPFWTTDRTLRVDFAQPASLVSIDVIGDSPSGSRGKMEIYDAADNLLDTIVTPNLARAEVFDMSLTRSAGDIAYAIIQSDFGVHLLDNLSFGEFEPWVVTAADGSYEFTDLPTGGYVIREVVPHGYTQTAPASSPTRLFATDVQTNPDQIVELDPTDGSVVNVLPAPTGSSVNGLAFDGQTLYFVSAGPFTLYELDPDTGDILESTPIQSGRLDGVAALDGLVYILDGYFDRLHVYDPQTNTIVNTINLNITDPSVNPYDSLGESDGRLIAGTNSPTLAYIDPVTGDVTRAFDVQAGPPDTALTAFGGEVYVGYFDPNTEIHVYNTDGVLQRTLDVGLRVSGLGGAAGVADNSHRVALGPSQTITGLDFGNQRALGEICGTKWEDLNGNGVRDAGEPPLADVTIYLDTNDNGQFEGGAALEPDDYPSGTQLNNIIPEATLTAIGSTGAPIFGGLVRAYSHFHASTGSKVIGNTGPAWFAGNRLLRIDFTDPAATVSIDYISESVNGQGKLEIYDATDNLLDTYLTATLLPAGIETMTLTRPTADIAYAIASPNASIGLLDNLQFGDPEPSVTVDATGEYCFTDLQPGDYVVREVVPAGYEQTFPIAGPGRLFTPSTLGSPDSIAELDPATGAVINQFPAPVTDVFPFAGLAFDGTTLYLLPDRNSPEPDVLYELDPDDGTVLDSTTLPTTSYEGLATLDGLVYILTGGDDIVVFDPQSNAIINTLDINAINPGVSLFGALGEIQGPDALLATTNSNEVVFIDPSTGLVTDSFSHTGSTDFGLTSVDGEIYLGFTNRAVQVLDRGGALLRTFSTTFAVYALGGNSATDGSHRVTVSAGSILTGLDFGNVPFSLPPEADAGAPYAVPEGGSVTLDGSGSLDFGYGPLTYLWDMDGDGLFGETGPAALRGDEVGVNPVFDASNLNGPRTENIALRVVNQYGKTDEDQTTVEVNNVAPQIQLIRLSPLEVDEGDTVQLTVEFADPGPGETYRVSVNFGNGWPDAVVYVEDGSGTATVTSRPYIDDTPSGTPSDTRPIRVSVSDGRESDTEYTSIVVNNVAPTLANVSVTPSIDEAGVATLTGEIIDPAGGSPLQVTNLAIVDSMIDGTTDSYAVNAQIDQADILDRNPPNSWDYDYPVPGGGGDNFAVVSTGTLLVNTAGTFSIAHWGDDGGRLRIDGVDVIVDDMQHPPRTFYADVTLTAGEHTFEWIGFERGGGAGWELSVAVGGGNRMPVRENFGWQVVGDPAPHPEIELLGAIDVTAYYPMGPTVERFTLTVDWGDSHTEVVNLGGDKEFSLQHPYADDNPTGTPSDTYAISLLVRDDDTGEGTAATSVTVNNVDPVIDSADLQLSATAIDENGTVTLTGTFTDVGTEDTHEVTIDWGDGVVSPATVTQGAGSGTFTATHQYWDDTPSGTPSDVFTITATVTDDDTGTGSASTTVTVNNVDPQLANLSMTSPVSENRTARLTGNIIDPAARLPGRVTGLQTVDEMVAGLRRATTASGSISRADLSDRGYSRHWPFNNPIPGGGGDNFAVVSTGTLLVSVPGTYSFAITGDDGGRLRIDGNDVIVDDSVHPPRDVFGDVTLSAGEHTFEWVGFEGGGGAMWELSVAPGPGRLGPIHPGNGWRVVGDTLPWSGIELLGPIDVTAYYLNEPATETFTLEIDWGDGTSEVVSRGYSTFISVEHQYLDDNPSGTPADSYPVSVIVRDDDGGEGFGNTSVTVVNVAPEVRIELDRQEINENESVTLTGNIVDIGSQDTHTATIDWGDGTSATVVSGLGSRYIVLAERMRWTEAEALAVSMGGHLVAINSQAENDLVRDLMLQTFGSEYDRAWIGLTDDEAYGGTEFGDTSNSPNRGAGFVWTNGDPVTYMNWQNGEPNNRGSGEDYGMFNYRSGPSPEFGKWGDQPNFPIADGLVIELDGPSFVVTHTYLDDDPTGTPSDTYMINVTVTDDDTGQGTASTTVKVNNVAPTANAGADLTVGEGTVIDFSGSFTDPGSLDTHQIFWDFGDVTPSVAGTLTPTHAFADDGTYTVTLTVRDDDGGVGTDTLQVEVLNVDPTINPVSLVNTSPWCGGVAEGSPVDVAVDFSDPGFDHPAGGTWEDFTESTIDWGDGNVESWPDVEVDETPGFGGTPTTGTVSGRHVYKDGGIYEITITVKDDDGGFDSITTQVIITGAGVSDAGVLQIIGTTDDDHVTVNQQGNGLIKVHADFLPGGAPFKTFDAAVVQSIYMVLCDGDDHITVAGNIELSTLIDAGAGDDHVNGGGGPDVLLGGDGDDTLNGGSGFDVLIGSDGWDQLVGGPGDDILIGDETIYDSDPDAGQLMNGEALTEILEQWNSDDDFETRQDALAGLLNETTIFDDDDEDALTGSSGEDWLYGLE